MSDNITEDPEIPVNPRSGGFAKVLADLLLGGGPSIEEMTGRAIQKAIMLFAELTMKRGTNATRFDISLKALVPKHHIRPRKGHRTHP